MHPTGSVDHCTLLLPSSNLNRTFNKFGLWVQFSSLQGEVNNLSTIQITLNPKNAKSTKIPL